MTHKVTWRTGQHGCARAGFGRWAPRRARAGGPAADARAAGRGGGGRGGRDGRWRGVPRGLVRLRRPPAARGPRQRGGRAPLLSGGERAGPGFCPAASRACQGALSIPGGVWGPRFCGRERAGQEQAGGGERWPPHPRRPSRSGSRRRPRCSGSARSFGGLLRGQLPLILPTPCFPPPFPVLLMNTQNFKSRGLGFKG